MEHYACPRCGTKITQLDAIDIQTLKGHTFCPKCDCCVEFKFSRPKISIWSGTVV